MTPMHFENRPPYDDQTIGRIVYWLIRLNGALCIVQIVAISMAKGGAEGQYRVASQFLDGNFFVASSILFLLTAIVFLWWKYRATINLFHLRGTQTVTPAGAIYWYFVPVAWFWKPYEAMRNLSNGYGVGDEPGVLLWWVLYWGRITAAVVVGVVVSDPARTIPEARVYAWSNIAIYAIAGTWCWAAARLVSAISTAESGMQKQTWLQEARMNNDRIATDT